MLLGGGVITPRACAWGKLNRSVCQSLSLLLAPDLEIYAYNESVDSCERLVYVCFELLNMALQNNRASSARGLPTTPIRLRPHPLYNFTGHRDTLWLVCYSLAHEKLTLP